MITVYGITDPYGQIRYVGMTTNPAQRFATHRSSQKSFEVTGFAVLAQKDEWDTAEEAKWIEFFGLGNLTNKSAGYRPFPDIGDVMPPSLSRVCELKSCSKTFIASAPHQRFCCATHKNLWHARDRRRIVRMVRQLGIGK